MATNKKSFILYADLLTSVIQLTDDEAGILLKHILNYVNDLNPICDNRIVNIAFEPIKLQLKRDLKCWESERIQRSEAGKKGMQNRWQKDNTVITEDNTVIKPITKITDTVTVTVTDTVNDNVIIKDIRTNKFVKPTIQEIINYCFERKNNIDANKFYDFYESKGWLVGKNKMKDWQACIRTWEKENNNNNNKPIEKPKPVLTTEKNYTGKF